MIERLARQHIVLLGIGHTNAHVVRMWGMNPIPDADLTCISNYPIATYSGMLPAVLAEQNTVPDMEIDLVKLCSSVGARLITEPVAGIDHAAREVVFADRPNVPFDALSIGIGSVPTIKGVTIEGDSLIKIKPMQTFLRRLRDAVERFEQRPGNSGETRPMQVIVVGAGVAGVEVVFCLQAFLAKNSQRAVESTLLTRGEQILSDAEAGTRNRIEKALAEKNIRLRNRCEVTRVTQDHLETKDGQRIDADLVIWATGASAPEFLSTLGMPQDERGFLLTDNTLLSTSGGPVFAVGDTGTIRDENLPKAGVYAVRQGPVLWENLRRLLTDQKLEEYRPQRSFLRLINTGDGSAVGQWKGKSFQGRWVMRLKDRIDSRFMEMYRPMPMMDDGDDPMQCRGCGCKLAATDLESVMAGMEDVELEDAAEIGASDDGQLVASTDFFSSPFTDAYLSGRVAALHSASDIVCTGARVTHALANVVLPEGDPRTQRKALSDFLAGARREFKNLGGKVVGGHTIVGPRMEVGFTVIGRAIGESLIRKRNLAVGDHLFLTKPLGIGVLLAANMRSQCDAPDYVGLVQAMLQPQHLIANVAVQCGITAGTDITGFGLAGHLLEMLESSGLSATIQLQDVPVLTGAVKSFQAGIESSLAPDNQRFDRKIEAEDLVRDHESYPVLFDPQTCGGLLFGVAETKVASIESSICEAGLNPLCKIGVVDNHQDGKRLRVV